MGFLARVTHSRNIAVRPGVGIAVFDSHVAIGAGQGVYMSAVAKLTEDGETARGIEAFSRGWPSEWWPASWTAALCRPDRPAAARRRPPGRGNLPGPGPSRLNNTERAGLTPVSNGSVP